MSRISIEYGVYNDYDNLTDKDRKEIFRQLLEQAKKKEEEES